jgi:hypothetical protein
MNDIVNSVNDTTKKNSKANAPFQVEAMNSMTEALNDMNDIVNSVNDTTKKNSEANTLFQKIKNKFVQAKDCVVQNPKKTILTVSCCIVLAGMYFFMPSTPGDGYHETEESGECWINGNRIFQHHGSDYKDGYWRSKCYDFLNKADDVYIFKLSNFRLY